MALSAVALLPGRHRHGSGRSDIQKEEQHECD
jgi:hypothetical protein